MSIEIKVPVLPESVADATIATWHKKPGDSVTEGENLVDLETDKVVLEVPAPADGVLESIAEPEGTTVVASQVLATFKEGAVSQASETTETTTTPVPEQEIKNETIVEKEHSDLSPAVRRLVAEKNIDVRGIKGSGKGGRILKEDVEAFINQNTHASLPANSVADGNRVEERVPM